ncbi:uncharacterized protein LOC117108764 [Anneissia japonica]|uniref:uncharacterized protein LOC117108764 n=1 Tax=Anneissia japonica TaxID=1529436 RepID=UPI00142560A6|nr:uncharacterized protein LOC117108764 [Anneissia japonica]
MTYFIDNIPPKVENLHCYSHYQGENRCEWSPIPNSENNLQTNYNCTCYENYQGATVIGKVTNSTCNLDDRLNSATTCSLTILSYNVLGSVAVTKSLTFNYIRIPYPPTGVKFMKNKNGELLLSWNYPLGYFDYNAHMLKYKVRYKAVSNSVWEELPAEKDIEEDTQYRFSSYHMEPFVKYMAQVRARQYVNFSNWSESAYYTTDEAKPERQVDATFETYDKGNTRSITIRWKHLEKKYSNGIILAYYLILQNSSHGVLRSTSEAANETEFTFKGLQKDMSYYVNITAANSVDNSTQTMLFIKAASYSYDVVIIVVILAFSIIILFSIGFLSWNKLKKAECMQPYPEPNFLDLSTYNFNIRDDNYNTIEEHEMFDDLKCQQPPEADQENLISFSSSDPIHPLIVKQVELPPTNIFDDSGLDQSKNREKCRLKSPQRKNDSCGPYAKCSITKCSPQHCISNSMGSLDTSGFNSRDTSSGQTKRTELSPSRSMPDILCESLMENNNSSENGYMLMNNSAQHSPACMQEAHTTSDDHINDYVIRTFFPGSRNQFSDSAPKNMQPPLVTPDIGGYVDGRNINLPRPSVPSNNASKTKNVSSYVDHLQLQQHTRGASNSSPNLFTNPNINSLKGNVKSASALHVDKVDNQTTLSAASSGYIPSAMMPSFYDGPPGSSPDTAGKPMKGSHQGPGGPCTRPVSSGTLTGSLVNGGTRAGQPVTHLAESRLSPKGFNLRRQQKSNGCIQTANLPLHKKSNNTTYMKPNGTSRQVPCNSTNHMAGSSSRKPPPHSLPLHHTHSPVPSRDSEQGCNRPSQPTQSSSQNHKTPHGKEVDSSSSVENGYIPLRSFSSPE